MKSKGHYPKKKSKEQVKDRDTKIDKRDNIADRQRNINRYIEIQKEIVKMALGTDQCISGYGIDR